MKIVSIGGGTGQPVLLHGLKQYTDEITAVVTVADAGSSSGILRKEMNVPPPGDIQKCLVALSKDPQTLHNLFKYRFDAGGLSGHSFGNLFVTALTKVMGDFEQAVAETGKILDITGRVLPCTMDDHHLCAELEDGRILSSEPEVESHGPTWVKKLYLDPQPTCTKDVRDAILAADIIVLGPGSLYTSILPNLLVTGVVDAIKESKGKVVFVMPIFTQPGETDGFFARNFVSEIQKYGEDIIDVVLTNKIPPPQDVIERYKEDGAVLVTGWVTGLEIVTKDLLPEHGTNPVIWAKKDWMRHDPDKLARAIIELLPSS